MQMSPYRIPVLFPESLRSHLFLVKINSEAKARDEKPAGRRVTPDAPSEEPPAADKSHGVQGVPSSPLND